jgi:hypothetical protein
MRTKRTCALLVVMATLLLTGCRSGCEEEKNSRPEESSLGRVIDSPAGLPLAPSRGGSLPEEMGLKGLIRLIKI